jgi:hypothetical protein
MRPVLQGLFCRLGLVVYAAAEPVRPCGLAAFAFDGARSRLGPRRKPDSCLVAATAAESVVCDAEE